MLTIARTAALTRSIASQWGWLSLPVFLLMGSWSPALAAPATQPSQVQADARRLDHVASEVDDALASGDWDAARQEWAEFDELWEDVEDGFRAVSRDGYRAIESTMDDVVAALRPDAPDSDSVRSLLVALRANIASFAGPDDSGSGGSATDDS